MDFQEVPYRSVKGITFCIFNSKELRKLSVLEITSCKTFDALGHAIANGLHDPALGPSETHEICTTCGLNQIHCPGHFGHINLPLPVFNPFLLSTLYKLLRGSCFNCQSLLAPPTAVQLTLAQLQVLDYGFVGTAQEMQQMVAELQGKEMQEENMAHIFHIKDKLKNHINNTLKGINLEEAKKSSLVKSVVECRQRIIKNFIREHLQKTGSKCPYCRTVQRPLALYYYSCLIFKDKGKSKLSNLQSFSKEIDDDDQHEGENISTLFSNTKQSLLTAVEAREHLRKLWNKESSLLQRLFGILKVDDNSYESPMDIFFLEELMVPPTRFRPISFLKGKKFENPQTAALRKVLQNSIIVRELLRCKKEGLNVYNTEDVTLKAMVTSVPGHSITEKLYNSRNLLQLSVNAVTDSEMDKLSKEKYPGMKQILEKKDGLFRKHMMGKRVDYAARSVISPDPYIMVDEVGVPMVFASKLTYPQPVTPWNVRELRRAVINGPNVYPGAVLVKKEDGSIVKLSPTNHIQREAIAKKLLTPSNCSKKPQGNKTVYRHIQSGDILLLNRQPTLHKPSIMAHKVHVLPGEKTLRLHYANCKCYNADFDGDEMNVHFPQSEQARSEAYNIASVNYQYLVPKDGTPLSGLIQDHVIAGSLLSMKGRFFNRKDYQELVFGALTFLQKPLKFLPPSLIKPERYWTGKQVISTVIINIIPNGKPPPTIEGSAKIAAKNWKNNSHSWKINAPLKGDEMSESEVIIRSGELLCGVLDKAHYGPTPYGLVHCCYELYGGQISTLLLTSLARLFTHFLQIHIGFTLGIEDIIVTSKANKKRGKIIKRCRKIGDETIAAALDVSDNTDKLEIINKYQDAHLSKNDLGRKQIDAAMKLETDKFNNEINKVCIPDGLWKKFPNNNLQLMILSGAKGSSVNAMQISCLLGQIELEGKRVPLMISGKSLPSFVPYDTSPRAGGFVDGRFLTGIRPQEYFFHCMAGREGLVDTAVKTSRSGYLQRCLIKHLEGIVVNYDLTVRDSDGSVIQFQYGEDGLDILKMQMLKQKQFPTLIKNYHAAVEETELKDVLGKLNCDYPRKLRKNLKSWMKRHGNLIYHPRVSGFTEFSSEFLRQLQFEHPGRNQLTGCEFAKEELCKLWHDLENDRKEKYNKPWKKCPDPISSCLQLDTSFGLISEKLDSTIEDYISNNHKFFKNKQSRDWISKKQFRNMMYFKYLKALAEPGEAVGLLAAQSIGEPSTQMTLNTFHFAGRGEMNVTLGIPRLREILMVASSNIATPSMDLPLLPIPDATAKAEELRKIFNTVHLSKVLEKLKVVESLKIKGECERSRVYCLHFIFLPYKAYKKDYFVNPSSILKFMENGFLKQIIKAIKKKLTMLDLTKPVCTEQGKTFNIIRENESDEPTLLQEDKNDGESSDEGEGDGDTTSAKQRTRHNQEQEYEEPEEEERTVNQLDEMSETDHYDSNEQEEEIEERIMSSGCELHSKKKISESIKKERINRVLSVHSWIINYDFDTKREQWCKITVELGLNQNKLDMTTLVEEEACKAIVYQTPGINRAFIVKDMDSKGGSGKMVKTEGVNIQEMFKYENILDMNRIYSNDIHAICRTYGIEAAARVIVKEVKNVFAVYGIEVDPRHLSLIADYMTFDGTYKPCNRSGMESSASPIQQMSFETTMKFLNSVTLTGFQEQLKSPSSRISTGHVVSGGTGCFDLLQPMIKVKT